MQIFSGSSNLTLAKNIVSNLGLDLSPCTLKNFSDGETFVKLDTTVRRQSVYIIQSLSDPVNSNLVELGLMVDAARRAGAAKIHVIIPYYGYARQDRRSDGRVAISARWVADILEKSGISGGFTVDIHSTQTEGFFTVPFKSLFAMPILLDEISKKCDNGNTVIASADVGGVPRAEAYAKRLGARGAVITKRRPKHNEAVISYIIGEVEGSECILIDDMIDTAGTLCNAATALMDRGAKSVSAACTHGVLSGPAMDRIENSPITELLITNTIDPIERVKNSDKVKILDVSPLLSDAIRSQHYGRSILQ